MARFTRRWPSPIAALALVVALAACASPSADSTPTAPTRTTANSSPVAASAPQPDNSERLVALWQDVHDQRLDQVHGDSEPDGAAFDGLATDDTTDVLLDHIRAARSDVPSELVHVEHWPQIDVSPTGDAADISDCVIVAARPAGQPDAEPTARSQVWTGTATKTSDSWVLDSVSTGVDNCVAPELNRELLDAYRAYHEAWTSAWDPPDPDHDLLDATMTGDRLEEIRRQLEADQAEGIAFRDPHDPLENAVVFDLGIGKATVSDCHEAHQGYGAFDVDTGERLDDEIPPVEPGQIHLTSVDLVRTADQTWKVAESALLTNANCELRGTSYVVNP